jgi:tetraacyldisaccharide 4'-kinase
MTDPPKAKKALKTRIAEWHYPPPLARGEKPRMEQRLLSWLAPLSWIYGWVVDLRSSAYRNGWLEALAAPIPVISVGNLTTGGTGKTPIVIALAAGLVKAGKRVVVLSRGYGASLPVQGIRAGDPRHGDEACLIQEQVPEVIVLVGRRREEVLQAAMAEYQPDYVILDDGFQYLRLKRSTNILLFDGQSLIGNGRLLPLGPLRESLKALRRADVIFVTRSMTREALDTVERWVRTHHPLGSLPIMAVPFEHAGLKTVSGSMSPVGSLVQVSQLSGRSIVAFSGLARPDNFERDLHHLDLPLLAHRRFADHHVYSANDLHEIKQLIEQNTQPGCPPPILVTTDKDWPKVREAFEALLPAPEIYTLQTIPLLDGYWFYEEFLTRSPNRSKPEPPETSSKTPGLPQS